MFDTEMDIINQFLNKKYKSEDVYLDNNVLVEKSTGIRIELEDKVFECISKAKRQEHLRRFSKNAAGYNN